MNQLLYQSVRRRIFPSCVQRSSSAAQNLLRLYRVQRLKLKVAPLVLITTTKTAGRVLPRANPMRLSILHDELPWWVVVGVHQCVLYVCQLATRIREPQLFYKLRMCCCTSR